MGGVGPADFADYKAAGIRGFGLGSGRYTPSAAPEEVLVKARAAVEAYDGLLADTKPRR